VKQQRFVILLMAALFIGIILTGCSDDDDPITGPDESIKATCEGCHTSEEMLKATALPDEPPEDEGEG
jgi:hypothetical protein